MWLPNENAVELLSGTQSCVTTWHSLTLIFVVTVTPSVGVDSNHTKPSFFVASTLYGSKSSSTFCIFSLFKSCKARRIRFFAKLHVSFQASALLRYQAWPKAKARPFWGLCAELYVPNYFLSIFRVPLYVMFRQGYIHISQSSIDFKQRCSFGDRRNGNNPAPPLSMLLGPSLALISARLYKLGFRLSWPIFCFHYDGFVFLHYFRNLLVLRSNLGFLQLSI